MSFDLELSVNQKNEFPNEYDVELFIKREDKIHPFISGNKYRKLKYNLEEARKLEYDTLLTFGGAYSNHIAAVATAGNEFGFKTIGIIRGEELADKINENPTLRFAKAQGMQFKFVSRSSYRDKENERFLEVLKEEFNDFYLVPEGGTNLLAVKGCEEILNEEDLAFDYICCAVGTGGTISGLINVSKSHQKILGFPALKGDFLSTNISKFVTKNNWELITDYHFGGYAKVNKELIDFINQFNQEYNIPLDPVYTGKLMFGVIKMIEANYFKKNSKILVIHTGGLQGISGMNKRLIDKELPLINE
ncbi:pyridoxal-phosphate dependent enzyme [Flavobacteriaceae bacterium S0825]|uniref:1-aminocyclopropane-1-carboxylate deaminase/D-cysteine desulfhydrase n=1 Tax=Gaetbulibacter sp. S0825 TaxID=2720084 RepID=UPI00143144D2|nr:pyridoxal-phosphate dependent enzyme [Gaetbulibacter sp. S0825]MCK0107683.1 pyridoxal-phosphate dependent enzyme [Flavobacteriaceae bacterium S0825]NIX63319.1 1-aminocyclopropane-1-carboxylate deaminase/D-cysteine desulfhydrase [Gaetbulibacter sp. S0825]